MSSGRKTSTPQRLDKLLVERGLAPSRKSAKELVESGAVKVQGFPQRKPQSMFRRDSDISVTAEGREARWVSRGAYKLIKGLDEWKIDPSGLNCVDIGASTGGFTQVLLSRGASKVAAVDVGYGQLAWILRNDPRVSILEKTNARYLEVGDIGWHANLLTVDASFISLRNLLPNLKGLMTGDGKIIALVKPQFEVGREQVGRGVVRDPDLHLRALRDVASFSALEAGLCVVGATYSPIRGPEGNIEFIFLLAAQEDRPPSIDFELLVKEAHEKT
jgi:23S rRNA (cytidine1920-2'-O)/16S rRNA (cytidine1409-2'-O)-methyltransferase